MPDIDTDFDDDGRQKVIDYVVSKYGKAQVAQIITYGTMAAKSSIKDVARVMDLPLPESNALAKLVSDKPGTELSSMLHSPITKKEGENSLEEKGYSPEDIDNAKRLREIYNREDGDLRTKILKEAERLEGNIRNTGIHAAGIIIAPKDLTDLLPVTVSKDAELWVTQIEGNVIEEAGVIKMDFLGLKTLSILKTALELIKQNHQIKIDLDDISLDDEKTFQLYQRGETNATFQFESAGMQKYLRELKPDKFDDLIAMNALYRPGPMAYIPSYIARKNGREAVTYDIADAKEFLEETYGITVYQEQVMLLSQKLAGFSKGDADVLRKAMGKKQKAVLDKMKGQFIEGGKLKGHDAEKLEKTWTDWEAFAQYAFNKSHSTCYAFVAYQTAYLKAHYPSEYMSAVLNHAGSIEKITFFMEECKRMGLKVSGPDINESKKGFAPNQKGEIRFGLGGLKGVGENAIENIIEERKKGGHFKDIFDFIVRVNQRAVNKKSIESLANSGTFDCFTDLHRAQYFNVPDGDRTSGIEKIIGYGQVQNDLSKGTTNTLFGDLGKAMDVPPPKIPACEAFTLIEKLDREKDVTGMYMSGHPLDNYKFEIKYYGLTPLADFAEIKDSQTLLRDNNGKTYKMAGLVVDAQFRTTKTNRAFGILKIEDFSGNVEFALFGEKFQKFQHYFEKGKSLMVQGLIKKGWKKEGDIEDKFEFEVSNIYLLETAKTQLTKGLELSMHPSIIDENMILFFQKKYEAKSWSSKFKV
jgi:DNA polymerase III subunit alpha